MHYSKTISNTSICDKAGKDDYNYSEMIEKQNKLDRNGFDTGRMI